MMTNIFWSFMTLINKQFEILAEQENLFCFIFFQRVSGTPEKDF